MLDGPYYTGFDVAGRITRSEQVTVGLDVCTGGSAACTMSYQYNLAGALTDETYPSGREVHHNYGTDGKPSAVSSRLAANRPFKSYAQNFSYNAAGGVNGMQLGNMRWESTTFNNRLQPTEIALGTTPGATDMLKLGYTYGTSGASYHDNNGNVLSQTITVPDVGATPGFVAVQSYTYDELNRLKSATENSTPTGGSSAQSWKQTYLFDRFGNRTFDTSGSNTTTLPSGFNLHIFNPTVDPSNNQFTSGQDYAYDLAGNVVQDAAGKKFNFDGEPKQTSFGTGGSSTNGGTYFYDGDGHRVKKIVGAELAVFVFDAGGRLVAEYTTSTSNSPQVNYVTSDALNTLRVNSSACGVIIARHDYMPFGEEITGIGGRFANVGYGNDDIRVKFTGKERDNENDLDYFDARYYRSGYGRFMGPDGLLSSGEIGDPQSWNRYSYVLNRPLQLVDPTGLYVFNSSVGAEEQKRFKAALADATANLAKIEALYGTDSKQYQKARKAVLSYGGEGVKNGVTIYAAATLSENAAGATQVAGVRQAITPENPNGQNIRVTFRQASFYSSSFSDGVGHEGSHVADGSNWVSQNFAASANPTAYQSEFDAYSVQSLLAEASGARNEYIELPEHVIGPGINPYNPDHVNIWKRGWEGTDRPTFNEFRENVDEILGRPVEAGGYGLTPSSTKKEFLKGSSFPR